MIIDFSLIPTTNVPLPTQADVVVEAPDVVVAPVGSDAEDFHLDELWNPLWITPLSINTFRDNHTRELNQ